MVILRLVNVKNNSALPKEKTKEAPNTAIVIYA